MNREVTAANTGELYFRVQEVQLGRRTGECGLKHSGMGPWC